MCEFYSNSMLYNDKGIFSYDDEFKDTYDADIYIQCRICEEYIHPSKGKHEPADDDFEEDTFACHDCLKDYELQCQQNLRSEE